MEVSRSILFFIIIAIATGIMAWLILDAKKNHWTFLAGIIVICVGIQWSLLLLYPDSVVGSDPWYHRFIYNKILETSIDKVDYYGTILYHSIISHASLWLGISFKWAEMLFAGLPYTIGVCIISYKFGYLVKDWKTGLLSGLSLSFATMFLYFGIEIIPSTLGMLFIMSALYLLIRISQNQNKLNIYRYIGIALLLIATMYINALIAIFAVSCTVLMLVGFEVYKIITGKRTIKIKPIIYVAIGYFVIVLFFWIINTGQINIIFRFLHTNWLVDPSLDGGQWPQSLTLDTVTSSGMFYEMQNAILQQQSEIPFYEVFLKKFGIYLYLFIGFIGCGLAFIPKYRNQYTVAFAVMALVIGLGNILNGAISRFMFLSRHTMLTQIVQAPMIGLFGKTVSSKIVIPILFAGMSLLNITTPYLAFDNPKFYPDLNVRMALNQQELEGIDDICSTWPGVVASDWYPGFYIYHSRGYKNWTISGNVDASEAFYRKDFSILGENVLIIVRNEIIDRPILVLDRAYKLNYDPNQLLIERNWVNVYDNGVIRGYTK